MPVPSRKTSSATVRPRLFAAINTLDGSLISMCQPRHRRSEWLKSLRLIDRSKPKHLALHPIVDNHPTHGHPGVQK